MRRLNSDQLVEILSRGMDLPRRLGTVELRCVAADGRHLGVEGIGDVHDERRLHRILAVREGVEDFERPVRGAPPGPPGASILGEPGQVARIASQLRRDAVVGMAPDRERENRSEEHTSELQSPCNLVCRLLLEKKKKKYVKKKSV